MDWKQQLSYKYKTATVLEKLIAVNVGLFLLGALLLVVEFLFQLPKGYMENTILIWFVFPNEFGEFIYKPWSIITYAFLHAGIFHILGNMLILYFSGIYFLNYFSPKRLLNYYFLGAIAGALIFMISYNLFPVFAGTKSYLIGASAAVMAILVGIATHIPEMRIRLMFLGSLKFWWIAAFLVALDVIQMPFDNNAGGHLAHLGGALLGFVYTKQIQKGNDIGKPFEKVADWIASLFSGKKKKPFRTVHRNTKRGPQKTKPENKSGHQQKIDAILDKIGKSGYDSLTKEEKDFLFNAGKD